MDDGIFLFTKIGFPLNNDFMWSYKKHNAGFHVTDGFVLLLSIFVMSKSELKMMKTAAEVEDCMANRYAESAWMSPMALLIKLKIVNHKEQECPCPSHCSRPYFGNISMHNAKKHMDVFINTICACFGLFNMEMHCGLKVFRENML